MTERVISLLTTGDNSISSGGHLYNRHMAKEASRHGAVIETLPMGLMSDLTQVSGQILIDSLVAWAAAPRLRPKRSRPLSAIVHQVPGGVKGPTGLRRARRLADLALYRKCDLIIAASTFLGDELVRAGISRDRISIVPPGCDIPERESGPPPFDLRLDRRLVLLNVANWVPNKGILELLDAVEPISSDDVVLHLVGSPDLNRRYTRDIQARLSSASLRGKVAVHGSVPKGHMRHFYAGADLVALTSLNEGYATVIAEALGSGVPVIGWDSGNLRNLFSDGVEGFLLPPGDVNGLTKALQRMVWDQELRSTLSANAANRGSDLPTWREAGSLFFAALNEVRPGSTTTL